MTIFSIIYSWYSFSLLQNRDLLPNRRNRNQSIISQKSFKDTPTSWFQLPLHELHSKNKPAFHIGTTQPWLSLFHWSCIFVGRFPTQHLQTTLPFSTGVRPSTLAFTGTGNRFTSFTTQSPVLLSRTTEVPIRFCTS